MNKEILFIPMKTFFLLCAFCFSCGAFIYFFSDDFYNTHIFLFFDAALGAAYSGFLLTAMPAWLGFRTKLTRINITLACLFFIAIFAYLYSQFLAMFLMCIFWLSLALFCLYMCILTKNFNTIILILFGFCGLKFAYLFTFDIDFIYALIHLNSAAVMLIIFRISMAVANSALHENNYKNHHFIPNVYYKNLSIFVLLLFSIFSVIFSDIDLSFFSIAAAFMIFARLKDFHHKQLLKTHYIVFLYLGILTLGIAYLIYGLSQSTASLHLIFIASICINILLVFNIASLRHNDLELKFSAKTYASFLLIFASLILRYLQLNDYAIICLSLSFVIQFFMLLNIFLRNKFKADG